MQMMHPQALRMKDFRAFGYVHRDLKPGNVMWLPRENRWTVIDFGCAARTGEPASLGFSLAYAAPEVISAYRRGDKTMLAQVLTAWTAFSVTFNSVSCFLGLFSRTMEISDVSFTDISPAELVEVVHA